MANQYVNKVIYGGETLIDLTTDTVTAAQVLSGAKFHLPSGEQKTGTCAFDVDSSSATATQAEVLATKTFAKNGSVLTGSMPNRGAVTGTISSKATPYTIPQGYHDGSGTVGLSSADSQALVANNIREGVEILGVTGTMSGSEGMKPQAKTVTPTSSVQTVLPDSSYNCLSQVTVNAIPYTETDNAAGGKTVTIGSAA